jgi:hypothetical protein
MELTLPVNRVSLGSFKPHVRRWNAGLHSKALPQPTGESMLAMPATSVRCKIGLQGVSVRLNLPHERFKVPECRRLYHSSDSMILKEWGQRIESETAAEWCTLNQTFLLQHESAFSLIQQFERSSRCNRRNA